MSHAVPGRHTAPPSHPSGDPTVPAGAMGVVVSVGRSVGPSPRPAGSALQDPHPTAYCCMPYLRWWWLYAWSHLLWDARVASWLHRHSPRRRPTQGFWSTQRSWRNGSIAPPPIRIPRMTATDSISEEREDTAAYYWCPEQQIYVGGVPDANAGAVDRLVQHSGGSLRIFGYGSLCWNPGTGVLADAAVSTTMGRAKGYRRCWAQKSTDHRGLPTFPGIVCTLLKDDEYRQMGSVRTNEARTMSLTEGLIYLVPPHLVQDCLSELDFREKGGYARDIIDVVEDQTGATLQCLLYRGTPDNPAFWPRALRSTSFAAAVIAAATGPSGPNEVYLHRLREFLDRAGYSQQSMEECDDTWALARMEQRLRNDYQTFFFYGCGSNQHNQLLLHDVPDLHGGEDAHHVTESVLITPRLSQMDPIIDLVAGSGHSGAITASGRLYLFGWNGYGQLGSRRTTRILEDFQVTEELQGIRIDKASLGFSHSLVIGKDGTFYAFGDNGKGQVTGAKGPSVGEPCTPAFLENVKVTEVSAGLYHSAAITEAGELIVYGCNRYGQAIVSRETNSTTVHRWKPDDGSLVKKVVCGRYHTVALDTHGRLWSFGDNRYGQLGRHVQGKTDQATPQLVAIPDGFRALDLDCGWSHNVAVCQDSNGSLSVFGWGRSDKGQLANTVEKPLPKRVFEQINVVQVVCGSEFTIAVDEQQAIWCCGWNEHGNLGVGDTKDMDGPVRMVVPSLSTTPGYRNARLTIAAGGAHVLLAKCESVRP